MRVKLVDLFPEHREAVCAKIIEILELDAENSFLLSELDENIEKQQKIMALKKEIQRVFTVSNVSAFKPGFDCKRPYLSIIRSVLRKQNYNVDNEPYFIKYEHERGLMKRTVKYTISRASGGGGANDEN